MSDDFNLIALAVAIVITGCVMLVITPYLIFSNLEDNIPTERWCNKFNDTKDMVGNYNHTKSYEAYLHYCYKNDSGWHLNASVPLELI